MMVFYIKTNVLISNEHFFDWLLRGAGNFFSTKGTNNFSSGVSRTSRSVRVKYYSYWIQYLLNLMFNWFDYLVDFYACLTDLQTLKSLSYK